MKRGHNKKGGSSEIASRIAFPVKVFMMFHGLRESALRLSVLEDITGGETQVLLHDLSVMLEKISDEIERE